MRHYNRIKRQSAQQQPQTKEETTMTTFNNIKLFAKDMAITILLAIVVLLLSKDGSTEQIVFPMFIILLGTLFSYGAYESRKEGK